MSNLTSANRTLGCVPSEDGYRYNMIIAKTFGDCIYVWREYVAFYAGWSSICFWIACQTPQLIQNCKRKSVAAISVWFLLQWFLGDVFNLFGAFLSGQLTTEKAVAILYVCLDMIISSQYVFYKCCGPNGACKKEKPKTAFLKDGLLDPDEDYLPPVLSPSDPDMSTATYQAPGEVSGQDVGTDSEPRQMHAVVLPVLVGLQLFMSCSVGFHLASQYESVAAPSHKVHVWERRILSLDTPTYSEANSDSHALTTVRDFWKDIQLDDESIEFWIGWGIGWISACIYLSSRMPQVIKNIKRGSVEGLSPLMFMCTVMGNLTYGLGVLLRVHHWSDITKALPFLIGSLGTLFFDALILFQFSYYRKKKPKRKLHLKGKNADPSMVPRSVHGIVDWSLTPFLGDGNPHSPVSPDNETPESNAMRNVVQHDNQRKV